MARSERQRWVEVYRISEPDENNANGYAKSQHREAKAIVQAFAKVGRVVRVEPGTFNGLVLKARRA